MPLSIHQSRRSGSSADRTSAAWKTTASRGFGSRPARESRGLAITRSGDAFEQEADRAADSVMAGRSVSVGQSSIAPALQRDEPQTGPPTEKPKSEEEKYKEAAKKLAEALRATETGKELEAKVKKVGEDFLATTEGKAIAGTALAGALAALIATNKELPVGIPEIPLDWLAPGLKAKLTWEGPVRTPTHVGLTLTTDRGVSVGASYTKTPESPGKPGEEKVGLTVTIPLGSSPKKKKGPSASEKIRADTTRLAAENAKWREAFKTEKERAEDKQFWDAYWRMQMSDPLNPLALPGLGATSKTGTGEKKEEDWLLMREATGDSPSGGFAPPIVHETLAESGQPLDTDTRGFMESRLGHDFSRVRVHTNARASESARAVNAAAYTVGEDIAFDVARYSPHTPEGRRLLAHELSHVVQQSGRAEPAAVLQRAEYGTYVSRKGPANYLDAGYEFYKTWGHPNVQRVNTVEDVLKDLDKSTKTIDTFRIVSHGASAGIETGLMTGLRAQTNEGFDFGSWFTRKGAEFTTEDRFRKHWTDIGLELVDERFFQRILRDTRKNATFKAILAKLGADTTTPASDTPAGILLRAMVDKFYLSVVKTKLDDGTERAAKITNRAVLDEFNKLRIDTYSLVVINAAQPADQAGVKQAIADFQAQLPAAFTGAGLSFGTLTSDEEKNRAEPYLEPGSTTPKLSEDISRSITESGFGGGPFLKKLRSVRGKIGTGTHIEIRGCNVGSDPGTLDAFRNFFGATGALPSISAPDLYQYFFKLNYVTYGGAASETTKLTTAFTTASTGVAQAFEDRKRILAGEMTRVVNESSLDELAKKYGWNVADLKRWNPEITQPSSLTAGQTVWLVMRATAPAGVHKTLKDFCRVYVGDEQAVADVQAANTQITTPDALSEGDQITIPAKWQKAPVASAKPAAADYAAAIRSGEALTAVDTTSGATTENRPVTYMDDPKAASALGNWLAAQNFDPKGRTAAELSKLYAGSKFATQAAQTYLQFLSRDYPTIVDPIFPEDPRYNSHIIRRP